MENEGDARLVSESRGGRVLELYLIALYFILYNLYACVLSKLS